MKSKDLKTKVENPLFLVIAGFFTPYGSSVGGFNTISIVPYIAIPPSFGNTQKTLLARNEIQKKSKIIAP